MKNHTESAVYYSIVGSNIKKYRAIRNFSLQDVAERVGLTKKTIQRYENGEIKIDMNRLADISKALNIDMSKLLEGTESFLGFDMNELNTVQIPIVGKISCGEGVLAFTDIDGYEPTPREWLSGGDYFYLRAKGDSMIGARIFDGDLLLIRKQEDVANGDLAAVLVGEEALLKRVYKNGDQLVLQSENPNYPPIFASSSETKIIGKLKKIVIDI